MRATSPLRRSRRTREVGSTSAGVAAARRGAAGGCRRACARRRPGRRRRGRPPPPARRCRGGRSGCGSRADPRRRWPAALLGAEHRPAVGVAGEQALVDGHLQRVPRLAVVHGDLFEDHLALARHLLGIEGEAAHAVLLDRQRLGPAVGGEVEVVGGRVVAGEGVVDPAQGLGEAVDLPRAEARRALEHHVLQEVGDAAVPRARRGCRRGRRAPR